MNPNYTTGISIEVRSYNDNTEKHNKAPYVYFVLPVIVRHISAMKFLQVLTNIMIFSCVRLNMIDAVDTAITAVETEEDKEDNVATNDAKMFNFASQTAGAVILDKNPSAKGFSNLLNDDKDKYYISPCNDRKWVVIGLSEDIMITSVVVANYERYSSMLKEFHLSASNSYPSENWIDLGTYTAEPKLGEQQFNITNLSSAHTRYLKIKIKSHYDNDALCTLSQIKVNGMTVIASFKQEVELSGTGSRDILQQLSSEIENEALTLDNIDLTTLNEFRLDIQNDMLGDSSNSTILTMPQDSQLNASSPAEAELLIPAVTSSSEGSSVEVMLQNAGETLVVCDSNSTVQGITSEIPFPITVGDAEQLIVDTTNTSTANSGTCSMVESESKDAQTIVADDIVSLNTSTCEVPLFNTTNELISIAVHPTEKKATVSSPGIMNIVDDILQSFLSMGSSERNTTNSDINNSSSTVVDRHAADIQINRNSSLSEATNSLMQTTDISSTTSADELMTVTDESINTVNSTIPTEVIKGTELEHSLDDTAPPADDTQSVGAADPVSNFSPPVTSSPVSIDNATGAAVTNATTITTSRAANNSRFDSVPVAGNLTTSSTPSMTQNISLNAVINSTVSSDLLSTDSMLSPQLVPPPQTPLQSAVMNLASASQFVPVLQLNCYDTLRYAEFQAKMIAKLQKSNSSLFDVDSGIPGGLNGTGQGKDNSINVFRILMQRIKTLEINNAIMDMYIIQLTDCYRTITKEMLTKRTEDMNTSTKHILDSAYAAGDSSKSLTAVGNSRHHILLHKERGGEEAKRQRDDGLTLLSLLSLWVDVVMSHRFSGYGLSSILLADAWKETDTYIVMNRTLITLYLVGISSTTFVFTLFLSCIVCICPRRSR